jgi:hypothetical protein
MTGKAKRGITVLVALAGGLLILASAGRSQSAKELAGTWTWVSVETARLFLPMGQRLAS